MAAVHAAAVPDAASPSAFPVLPSTSSEINFGPSGVCMVPIVAVPLPTEGRGYKLESTTSGGEMIVRAGFDEVTCVSVSFIHDPANSMPRHTQSYEVDGGVSLLPNSRKPAGSSTFRRWKAMVSSRVLLCRCPV